MNPATIIGAVQTVAGKYIESQAQREKFAAEAEKAVQAGIEAFEDTQREMMKARMAVIVAELQQTDLYTKRMRPTIGYGGLAIIGFNYCLVPLLTAIFGNGPQPFALPTEFWVAWGGVVGTYAIGRSLEKVGVGNAMVRAITGKGPEATARTVSERLEYLTGGKP